MRRWLLPIVLGLGLPVVLTALGWLIIGDIAPSAAAPGAVKGPSHTPQVETSKPIQNGPKWIIVRTTSKKWKRDVLEDVTWHDERVMKWVADHGIVEVVNTDFQQERAKSLSIEDTPAIVAIRDDVEFDRIPDYQSPTSLLEWLEGIDRGDRSIELAMVRLHNEDSKAGETYVRERWGQARGMEQAGRYEQAADEFVWLWKHMLEYNVAMSGVRGSYIADDMKHLAASSKAARAKIAALRDETGAKLNANKVSHDDLNDWIDLNETLKDSQVTLHWFDRAKTDRRMRPLLKNAFRLDNILIADGRWSELVLTQHDPMFLLEQERSMQQLLACPPESPEIPVIDPEKLKAIARGYLRETVGKTYVGLLASGQEKLATDFAKKAREYFGAASVNTSMVSWAIRAREPRIEHLKWLSGDPNDEAAAALRELVKKVLTDVPPC